MKKIITTLTAMTFALGLAAAAPAQVTQTPGKPAVQGTQAAPTQVASPEAAKPGDKTTEAVKPGEQPKAGKEAKKAAKKAKTEKGQAEKKAGAQVVTPQVEKK